MNFPAFPKNKKKKKKLFPPIISSFEPEVVDEKAKKNPSKLCVVRGNYLWTKVLPDRRDEHTSPRLFSTLRRTRTPDPAVWPASRVSSFAK
jgi:hypothetical protein